MIAVGFESADGGAVLTGFRVSGHTGVRGESVVCAAVSSACYMAANTITEVLGVDAQITVNDGYMRVAAVGDDLPKVQIVLRGLRLHLEQLAQQYPDKIKITYTEVQ